jgi:uncharacterized membrane protein
MGWVFFFTTLLIIIISLLDVKGQTHSNDLIEDHTKYQLSKASIAMIVIVLGFVMAMYIRFW